MVYSHAIAGDPQAARFLSPGNPSNAPDIAADIMATKLKTYLQFNQTFPGYGGFLPWYTGTPLTSFPHQTGLIEFQLWTMGMYSESPPDKRKRLSKS